MRTRELQKFFDDAWPGAWNVQPNQSGFSAVRIDAVDLIPLEDLAMVKFDASAIGFTVYATIELKTKYIEDGFYFALWLMPKAIKARKPRKAARRLKR